MKRERDWAQLGCLGLLLAWALFGVMLQLGGAWRDEPTGDDEGGGPFAVIGLLGFVLFVVIFGARGIVRAVVARSRRERRGFPVEARPGADARREAP